MNILVLNAGSSSIKASIYKLSEGPLPETAPQAVWEAAVDWSHHPGFAEFKVKPKDGPEVCSEHPAASHDDALPTLLEFAKSAMPVHVVGHRVVHGGPNLHESVRLTAGTRAAIAQLAEFAPEHNKIEIAGVDAAERTWGPDIPQIAVFDTGFHANLPPEASTYGGPFEWVDWGIRKYGFHGISYQYATRRAGQLLNRDPADLRIVAAHLGNGSSLAAIRGGRSIDTTMGFTPLDGLVMGTRSGSVDPGILIYLMRHRGYTPDTLDRVLNRESGLKGVSGVSSDMRSILEAVAGGKQRAQLAFDIYIHRIRTQMGAMLAALGGMDVLVFTAGVGENAAPVRSAVCRGFEFLGLKLADPPVEEPGDRDIAALDSTVRVLVVHAEENWEIARECARLANEYNKT